MHVCTYVFLYAHLVLTGSLGVYMEKFRNLLKLTSSIQVSQDSVPGNLAPDTKVCALTVSSCPIVLSGFPSQNEFSSSPFPALVFKVFLFFFNIFFSPISLPLFLPSSLISFLLLHSLPSFLPGLLDSKGAEIT